MREYVKLIDCMHGAEMRCILSGELDQLTEYVDGSSFSFVCNFITHTYKYCVLNVEHNFQFAIVFKLGLAVERDVYPIRYYNKKYFTITAIKRSHS